MRSAVVLGIVLTLSLAVAPAPGRQADPPRPADDKKDDRPQPRLPAGHELMRAKLRHAQEVLEGLAVADFKKTAAAADELARISQAAEFLTAYKSREYQVQMHVFRRSAETMSRRAGEKNLDGVTLAYMDMTMTCLKCHQHTRDDKIDARLPALPLPDAAAAR
jgi:hypothetical protein